MIKAVNSMQPSTHPVQQSISYLLSFQQYFPHQYPKPAWSSTWQSVHSLELTPYCKCEGAIFAHWDVVCACMCTLILCLSRRMCNVHLCV